MKWIGKRETTCFLSVLYPVLGQKSNKKKYV